jgi:hypothetical protein
MFPCERLVTIAAMDAETEFIPIVLPTFPVTDFACRWCPLEYTIQMTLFTGNCTVFSDKRKIRSVMALGAPLQCFLLSS